MSAAALTWYGKPYKTHKWTSSELAILRRMYHTHTCQEVADAINARTRQAVKVTANGVAYQAKKMSLLKSETFRRQHPTVRRGQYGHGRRTHTKHQPGVPYKLRRPDKDGYYWFVVDPATGRRRPAHRYLMEQQHGPLAPTQLVVFAGGDKRKLEGLKVITRGDMQHMVAAQLKTRQTEARLKAWATRRRKMATKTYLGHNPYQFAGVKPKATL